jgi:thiol-disulfide isomerase/thioredoxin
MLATAVVAILLIVSCTKDPYITPGPGAGNSISLGSAAFSAEYVFSTNYDWTARSSGPWLTVSPSSGMPGDNIILKLSAGENANYDNRTATVTITAGEITRTFTVDQAQNEGFELTKTDYSVGKDGGNITIPISANVTYTCTVSESARSWLAVTQTKALSNYNIVLTVSKNETYGSRTGTVTIAYGNQESVITITQSENEGFEVTTTDYSVGKDGGNITIPVRANVTYTCTVSESAKSWLSVIQTKALSNYNVVLSASKNETYDSRTGTVTIAYGNQESIITVTQSQNDELIVTQKEFNTGGEASQLKIPVKTNIQYECSVQGNAGEWITVFETQTKGLEEYFLILEIAQNNNYTERVGQVKITGAGKESYITITQDMRDEIKIMYQKQRASLSALFKSLNGNQWKKKDNWDSDKPLDQWFGLTVDEHGFVTKLELPENNLKGTLPAEIGDLVKLQSLYLGYNYGIGGSIPSEIGNLKELGFLNLFGNELTGEIPEELYSLSELFHLDLGVNKLSGGLSSGIARLSKLLALWLHYNNFSGPLPKELGQMNLTQLALYNNSFSGSLPDELGSLNNLDFFSVGSNKLSGFIPISILNNPNIWEKFWINITAFNDFDLSNLTYYPAPDYTLTDVEGNSIDLGEEYASHQYTVLYSWTTWCPYASGFHPTLISLYNQYKSKGLEVIGYYAQDQVADEIGMTDQKLKEAADYIGMPWSTVYLTTKYKAFGSALIQGGSPTIHVVDKLGNIVFSTFAFADSRNDLGKFLEERLGEGSDYSYYASTDYSADGKVRTYQTHTTGDGIKLIFTGDAFTDRDHADGTFDRRMNQAVEAFFSEEPYASLRNRFDVYSVAAVSKNREIADDSETAFGTYFGSGTLVGGDDEEVFKYALKVPGVDMTTSLVTVVVNSPNYSGTCYMYEDNAAVCYSAITGFSEGEFAKLIRHESGGHGFGKLLDEYAYSGTITDSKKSDFIYKRDVLHWGGNVDVTSDPSKIQWSVMLSDARYKDFVEIYEGALTFAKGAWRPTYNSIMHLNTEGYNAPSRFSIYKRIILLSENREATFDEFAEFDAPNLSKTTARPATTERTEPLAPPVFIRGSWKDAGKRNIEK